MPRLLAAAVGLLVAAAVTACDADVSSGPSAEPTQTTSPATSPGTASETAPGTAPDTSSGTTDPQSQALCSALTNAVGTGTAWQLDPPTPASRVVAGVSVPACEDTSDAGTLLTVAYLPTAGGLTGPQLLTALCQAVVGAEPPEGARSCSAPAQGQVEQGTEVRRADIATGDGGVLVLSFGSNRPEYVARAVKDLGAVGQVLAGDPLLARALG